MSGLRAFLLGLLLCFVVLSGSYAWAFELLYHNGETYYYRTDDGRVLVREILAWQSGLVKIHEDKLQRKRYFQAADGRIAVSEQFGAPLSNTPDYEWNHGCSPTSAGMLMGFYDRNGYADMHYENLVPDGEAELSTFGSGTYVVNGVIASA